LILVLNKNKAQFSPKNYWGKMKAPLSKATKNNDSNKENLRFFDKW